MAESIISPYSLQSIWQMLQQKRATGQIVTDQDMRSAYQAELEASAAKQHQYAQLAENKRQFEETLALRKKMLADEQFANKIRGIGSIALLGGKALGSETGKKFLKKIWPGGEDDKTGAAVGDSGTPSTVVGTEGSNIAQLGTQGGGEAITPDNIWQPMYNDTSWFNFADTATFVDSGSGASTTDTSSTWNQNWLKPTFDFSSFYGGS